MSKMSQAIFSGQTFAQENFSLDSRTFEEKARSELGMLECTAAIDEFATIKQELSEHYACEPFVEAIVEDGIPF